MRGSETGPEPKPPRLGQEQGLGSGLGQRKQQELGLVWRPGRSWSWIQKRLCHEPALMDC